MNKHLYINLLKTLQYGGKKNVKHLLSQINNNWFTISDSTARDGGNSSIDVDYSTFGLHIYGTLGAIQGLSKALVGFCIAKSDDINIPKNNYRGIFFKAVFDPKINYLFQIRTSELKSQENYVAPIKYSSENNNKIFISFDKFKLTYRGNNVGFKPINQSKINSIGIQINRSNQREPYYSKIPLKFNFTLLSDIYLK